MHQPSSDFEDLLANDRMALRRPPKGVDIIAVRNAANSFMINEAKHQDVAQVVTINGPRGCLIRLYKPHQSQKLPLIVYFHGGGYVMGSLDTHDGLCRMLANTSNSAVAAVDYRLSPEYSFPVPLDDCSHAVIWLCENGANFGLDTNLIALAGDSAGGQLAMATALDVHNTAVVKIRHLGLLYPLLDPLCSSASSSEFAEGFMLTKSFVQWAWEAYEASSGSLNNPRFNLRLSDLTGMPPTTIITAGFDPLRDEGEELAERLLCAGINCEIQQFDDMIHGFAGMPRRTPRAEEAIGYLSNRIKTAFAI